MDNSVYVWTRMAGVATGLVYCAAAGITLFAVMGMNPLIVGPPCP